MASLQGTKRENQSSPASSQPTKKRRAKVISSTYCDDDESDAYELDAEVAEAAAQAALAGIDESKPKRARKKKGEEPEEKRLKRFKQKAPGTYLERLHRVKTQRMFLIDRSKKVSEDRTHEEEEFDIAGTTGNIYKVTIGKLPKCSCPDNEKGNQCKHIIYILVNVLKTREDLAYQLAFFTTELAEIFAKGPPSSQSSEALLRPPTQVESENARGEIIWCKAACGQNIHRQCFQQWAKAKPGQTVRCVYCRTPWKHDEKTINNINKDSGKMSEDGYVNVADDLGISGERDMSTYHPHWVARQGYGGYGGYRGYRGYG
ncbi:hypothetical protein LSUE1_G004461 [Lachnellula suecica]|uniref:SWIM-type domain-containing protein n=1 Tax=Lachnellula suecica TaxID=602035 RepID=A0A8T9CC40_9HELO|nr:hypothetical protein LSUE1_G004461 [Lachnellula suecica]